MIPLHFPDYSFKLKNKENKTYIWDEIRKKDILLTPEEWVRQHALKFLIEDKNYHALWMAVEKQFTINGLHKRADIVVYDEHMNPYIIVECKAPTVQITQDTFDQIARYNLALGAKYLMLTNGLQHYYCRMNFDKETYIFLEELPDNES
jgi:type I site-specific restriction endonuclease